MPHDPKACLLDIMKSGELIQGFTRDLSYDEYKCSSLVRAAVERHFEIIGEALNRLAKIDTELAAQVTDYRLEM